MEKTTIQVRKSTLEVLKRARLTERESYDEVIRRLLGSADHLAHLGDGEHRFRKMELLGELARRQWERDIESGRVAETKKGWKVKLEG